LILRRLPHRQQYHQARAGDLETRTGLIGSQKPLAHTEASPFDLKQRGSPMM
jgi:hypothetical protein